MAPRTRQQLLTERDYILEAVLDFPSGSIVHQALDNHKISSVEDILDLDFANIDTFQYPDPTDITKFEDLPIGHKNTLKNFALYVSWENDFNKKLLASDWSKVTRDEWLAYRFSDIQKDRLKIAQTVNQCLTAMAPPSTANNATSMAGNRTRTVESVIAEWKKGIKRDSTVFPILKNDNAYDRWNIDMSNQATAQLVDKVLDTSYVPTANSPDEAEFNLMQAYMFNVLSSVVQTDHGRTIIREYQSTRDAQKAYAALRDHYESSPEANMSKDDLYTYIVTATIANAKNGCKAFVLHWLQCVRQFNSLTPDVSDHIKDNQKLIFLQQAVSTHSDLKQVADTARLTATQVGKPLTFSQYKEALLSAAATCDKTSRRAGSIKPRRHVFTHDLHLHPDPESIDLLTDADDLVADFHDINLDTHYSVYQATTAPITKSSSHTGQRKAFRPGTRVGLRRDQWKDLNARAQQMWDKFSEAEKQVILRYTRPNADLTVQAHFRRLEDEAMDCDPAAFTHVCAFSHHLNYPSSIPDAHSTASTTASTLTQSLPLPALTSTGGLPPGHPHRALSSQYTVHESQQSQSRPLGSVTIHLEGDPDKPNIRFQNNLHKLHYHVHAHRSDTHRYATLMDRGSNGGVAGDNVVLIHEIPGSLVDVTGVDNHQITDLRLADVGGLIQTQKGPMIAIMHSYAYVGHGKTIHSAAQFESFGHSVDDRSVKVGGLQRITTKDGYIIPLSIRQGLPYLEMRRYTEDEFKRYPHVFLTSPGTWDPSVLDHEILPDDDDFFDSVPEQPYGVINETFDEVGDLRVSHCVTETFLHSIGDDINGDDFLVQDINVLQYHVYPHNVTQHPPDVSGLRPHFLWMKDDIIRKTLENSTQMARVPMSTHLRKWFKSPNPAMNIPRRNEDVATDTVYSDTPAVDSGVTIAQFFVGTKSLVCDIYPMQTEKQFPSVLLDNIRERGAPNGLISDSARVETSQRAHNILRDLHISDWQSEAYHQHQNFAERHWQTVKRLANTILNRSGAPANCWLLALSYVTFVLNLMSSPALDHQLPLAVLTGSTPDTSILLRFPWWHHVYARVDDSDFPSENTELKARLVGFGEHVGHALTYKLLTDDTQRIIYRSSIRSAEDPTHSNLRLDTVDGETLQEFIKSKYDKLQSVSTAQPEHGANSHLHPKVASLQDLVGRSVLLDQENGEKKRARIVQMLEDQTNDPTRDKEYMDSLTEEEREVLIRQHTKFILTMDDDTREDTVTYGQLMDFINNDDSQDKVWNFKRITAHEGPLTTKDPTYKGSKWNVLIEWENGEITTEPLSLIAADDPVTCAIYAREHKLLELDGWKRFKRIANRQKKLFRMANQAKLRSYRTAPKYMYGYEIPRDYAHAVKLDQQNGNTKWQDCTALEMSQLHEYNTFKDIGIGTPPPNGYKKIRVHLVYAVKHDGRHKARLVADGHLTDIPVDSVYSGVVSLRGLRLVIFLAELNGLEVWGTDIGNAYLEAYTKERLCIKAGPEFRDLEGHTLIIVRALYGLRSSGLRWHEKFADCMRDQGFQPCRAEPDIWLRESDGIYEYVAVYVDDLAMAVRDPKAFVDILKNRYKFKLKGTGPIEFHLGCDFYRDDDGVLCMSPKKYLERMADTYTRLFGAKPKLNVWSPLEKGDHPELDTSPELSIDDVQKYQSLIGSMQWAVSLGRFDIATAVMTMSSFRSTPREGHLERAKRMVSYLLRFKDATIRFRTQEPDYSDLPKVASNDWTTSVYIGAREQIQKDAPKPLGKAVVLTHYVDANLYHDWNSGRAVTGILSLINQTPIDWFSKKQATVETATYGSEFVATRICVDRAVDLRLTLRYLGVPIRERDVIFGDNESVVNSSMRVDAKLHKRHNALSFHRVREAIAAGYVQYFHMPGKNNPADILSKHWGYTDVWNTVQPFLFWKGDTANIPSHAVTKDTTS